MGWGARSNQNEKFLEGPVLLILINTFSKHVKESVVQFISDWIGLGVKSGCSSFIDFQLFQKMGENVGLKICPTGRKGAVRATLTTNSTLQ